MSTSHLESLYDRIHSTLTQSVIVYTSADRVHFDAYPSLTSGFSTTPFATILPELRAHFAVQITGPHIQGAIDLASWPQDEVNLYGYSVPIVPDATQLISAADGLLSAAFVRAESSLVIWNDYEDNILSNWSDIACSLQNRFASSNPIAAPPGDTYINQYLHVDALGGSLLHDDSLSFLNDFSHLATVPGPATPPPTLPSADSYLHTNWPWVQGECPSVGSLQLALQVLTTSSPSSDAPSSSFEGTPFTVELPTISPALISTADLPEDDDGTSSISVDFSSSDGVESPRSSDGSQGPYMQLPNVPVEATASFRRHSFGETTVATARILGKTKRGLSADDDDDDYVSDLRVKDETVGGDTSFPITGTRNVPSVHMSKRRRSITQATSTSAPALFPVPLPNVEPGANYDGVSNDESPTAQPPTASVPAAAPSLSPPPPASTSTPRRARRRTGTGAGRATRAKRTPCKFCGKTFSRVQDMQRHTSASCEASPDKTGVQCPECCQVLSRLDAAQRHWRGHENPTCPPPEWMNRP